MICHVYKRGRFYWGKLRLDHESRLSRFSLGTSDRRVAQTKLLEEATKREKRHAGLLPPDTVAEAAVKPLSELLAAFLEDLQAKGRADTTASKYDKTLTKLFGRVRWRVLADVTARSFCEWRVRSGLSPKTLNDLLGAMMTFLGWLVYQRLALDNPLTHVQRIDTRATRQQYRRALSMDELRRLLDVAPFHRRVVYLMAARTGLRRSEMMALCWADVVFEREGSPPSGAGEGAWGGGSFLRVRASTTKNRKDAVLPLPSDLVAALISFRPENAAPFSPVLRGFIPRLPTFRKDLVRAGIAFVDEQGRRADLHALRVTYGTSLTASGASPRVVMELMRHSDIKLTMKIYTDATQLPLTEAVARLSMLTPFQKKEEQSVL